MHTPQDAFDNLLDRTVRSRADAPATVGLEQRLLAHLALANPRPLSSNAPGSEPIQNHSLFTTADRVRTARSARSLWTAIFAHAAAFLLIFALAAHHVQLTAPRTTALVNLEVPTPPPVAPKLEKVGGGGGQTGPTPITQGHLPRLATEQLLPPKAPPLEQPRLAVEPSVVVQPDLKMADNKMPDLGAPTSNLKGFSMGNGNGSGIGSGNGSGIGPGSGGNTGGGPIHIGGSVHPPSLLRQQEAEYSEEARKAKFSGNVQVYLWVDEQGNPSHVKVVRGVGMGLDEKAMEAVSQYRFKPAVLNGRPVKVDLYVEVNFQIF